MKLQRITQVLKRFVFGVSLTRNVNLNALRYEPFILLPDTGGKFLFHLPAIPFARPTQLNAIYRSFGSLMTGLPQAIQFVRYADGTLYRTNPLAEVASIEFW